MKKPVYTVQTIPFVFAQKEIWFVLNGTQTIRRWGSARLQSHPHIHTFNT